MCLEVVCVNKLDVQVVDVDVEVDFVDKQKQFNWKLETQQY